MLDWGRGGEEGSGVSRRGKSTAAIAGWAFAQLRQYVHDLVRHERWADGYSSPIMDSLIEGQLQRVAERLETDDTL